MSQKNSKTNAGFTIIEVLIVMAIAGLILLIVFLAVPALQRNSRNTTIKNDVQNVLGGIAEFQGANSGRVPTAISTPAGGGGLVTYSATGLTSTTINIQGTTAVSTVATAPTTPPTSGTIQVRLGFKCAVGAAAPVANSRAAAAYYAIETQSSTILQCQDS